jgi:primosomal protein N' (replication factor Y)
VEAKMSAKLCSMSDFFPIARIVVLTGIDRALDYRIPQTLQSVVAEGSLVAVPLGRRNEQGIVVQLLAESPVAEARLKYILRVLHDVPALTPGLVQLARWMSRYYMVPVADVLSQMIPGAVRKGMQAAEERCIRITTVIDPAEPPAWARRATAQWTAYAFLLSQPPQLQWSVREIAAKLKITPQTVLELCKRGVTELYSRQVERIAYSDEDNASIEEDSVVQLNDEQQAALDSVRTSLDARAFRVHLLQGVTGSGKTEVYLQALLGCLKEGGTCLYLVPEIALTPQTLSRLQQRLKAHGFRCVVWHYHLSEGERRDAWEALVSGKAQVVVGARSAVFAPLPNLRLIIVDEEHEAAYKQEESPRYHGRDVAVYRGFQEKATVVLGSATPSMESIRNASTGKYQLNLLNQRVVDRALPRLHIVDMNRETHKTTVKGVFSPLLVTKLKERLARKEQSILFLNRRGYHTRVFCPDCEEAVTCPHCAITLTYHREINLLRCHFCDHQMAVPTQCPSCGSRKIRSLGSGTQRIEDIVKQILPHARIQRMDADTLKQRHLFRSILNDFREQKLDILIGTQMIAKGLDFPNVTLVGLLDADTSLHLPDFRASERTFQLLVQVAGRAGRGEQPGEVVLQTHLPNHPVIQLARAQDVNGFAAMELKTRQAHGYPPYRHLIHHLFKSENEEKVEFYIGEWAKLVRDKWKIPVDMKGPAPAPLSKLKDYYRWQVCYLTSTIVPFLLELQTFRQAFRSDPDVIDTIDVDPAQLM